MGSILLALAAKRMEPTKVTGCAKRTLPTKSPPALPETARLPAKNSACARAGHNPD
jgi:hypothetical protein